MTKYEIWKNLRNQTKLARKDKNEKREAITTCDWNTDEKSCIKVFQVQSLGVPTENMSNLEYSIRNCDDFCEGTTCSKICNMRGKNKEYNESLAIFQGLRRARNKAFWDMVFSRGK